MAFNDIFQKLTSQPESDKYFYTEPEIAEQENIVMGLQRSGMSPMVVKAQEQKLEKMKSRRQAPTGVDQAKRENLNQDIAKRQSFGLPQATAAIGDVISASGASFGTRPTTQFKDLQDRLKKESDESKAELEKQFLNDPNSDASVVAQDAAARLLNKPAESMRGMSLNQINASLPMWKEALNNEQSMKLKEMAQAFSAQEKEEGRDLKKLQFEALQSNRSQLAEDRQQRMDMQRQQQMEGKVQKHALELQKENLPELVSTYNELQDVFATGKNVKGIGFLESHVPGPLLSAEAVRNRTNLQQLANALLKARSGAAVSDQEYRRFLLELQAGEFPTEKAIKAHLGKMGKDAKTVIAQLEAGVPPEALKQYKERPGAVTSESVKSPEALVPATKTIVKKEYSPSRNKTRITYSDGTQEIQDGRN